MTPEELAEHKKQRAIDDVRYKMAFFDWYWVTHGRWQTFKQFLWQGWYAAGWLAFFKAVGSAVGQFLMKKLFLDGHGL